MPIGRDLRLSAVPLILAVLVVGACAQSSQATPDARATAAAAAPLTDANIAAIVVAANNADIGYAELALARGTNEEVKRFARLMIADHGGVNTAARELVTRLGVTPEDNEASLDLRDDAEATRDTLRELSGAAFDSAYRANEGRYHPTLLGTSDSALIPGAKNADLRELLVGTRPAVEAHLRLAEQIRDGLRGR